MAVLLWLVAVVVFLLWLFGQALSFGGNIIHFLLVIVVLLVIYNLATGRRT